MPVPKFDTKGNWIRLRAEKHRREGKGEEEADLLAREDWVNFFRGKFILDEYDNTITKSEEQ